MQKTLHVRPVFGLAAVPFATSGDNHLLLELIGSSLPGSAERPPIETVLCLDVSPSMDQANKLPLAKKSAIALIDNLRDGDSLGLLFFSSTPQLMLPLGPLDANRRRAALEKISAATTGGGGTNISGTLIDAYEQFRSRSVEGAAGALRRVIFLTDGCPNTGVTGPAALAELAAKVPEGVSLTTMGYGTASDRMSYSGMGGELDTVLLQRMAEGGGGNYYYMQDADSVRRAFANELAGLLSCVAQDLSVSLKTVDGRLELVEVLDNVDAERKGGELEVRLPDLLEGETRYLLFKVRHLAQGKAWARPAKVADVVLRYQDPQAGRRVELTLGAKLQFVSEAAASTTVDAQVATQIEFLAALAAQRAAIAKAEAGDLAGASLLLSGAAERLLASGTERGATYAAGINCAVGAYSSAASFAAGRDKLLATVHSSVSGRSTGGFLDEALATETQRDMQERFAAGSDKEEAQAEPAAEAAAASPLTPDGQSIDFFPDHGTVFGPGPSIFNPNAPIFGPGPGFPLSHQQQGGWPPQVGPSPAVPSPLMPSAPASDKADPAPKTSDASTDAHLRPKRSTIDRF